MHGLILAAGRGSRLKKLTSQKPKSFNKYNGKRFIDLIINNFKDSNIKKINIVVGYKKSLFKQLKYKKLFNQKWNKTSIFYSLYCARKILCKNTCLISYSDIIYKKDALKLLKNQKGNIVILNNVNWKKIWTKRFKKPLKDLESFNYISKKKTKYLTNIGEKPKNMKSIKGQFSGIFKITPSGWKTIIKFIKNEKININKLDMTTFFSKFVRKYKNMITIADYKQMWFEVDTLNDFKILNLKNK